MRGSVPDMFRQHRNDPDPTAMDSLRDRLDAIAVARREALAEERPVRGRLTASASLALRSRLAQPVLSTTRG